jgi:hypothetical protein
VRWSDLFLELIDCLFCRLLCFITSCILLTDISSVGLNKLASYAESLKYLPITKGTT